MLSESVDASQADDPSDSSDYSNSNSQHSKHLETRYNAKQSDEKILLNSLQDLEADDLSLHLFSSHRLKRRVGTAEYDAEQKQSKFKRTSSQETLARRWTAWPLLPDVVPRQHNAFGRPLMLDAENREKFTDIKSSESSSTALAELLEAEILKHARGKYVSRAWGNNYYHSNMPITDFENNSQLRYVREVVPIATPLIDDDKAAQLLRPSVQHILAHLDDLLIGLHKARTTSVRLPKQKSSLTSDRGAGNKDAQFRLKPQGTRRKFLDILPRDWSEVLGIASMTGWDSNIINRANVRCMALFDEGMHFRTLLEYPAQETDVDFDSNDKFKSTNSGMPVRILYEVKSSWPCPSLMPSCQENFLSLADLKTHTQQQHSESFEYADFRHSTRSLPVRHALEDYTCPDSTCQAYYMVFNTRKLLHLHVSEFHKNMFSLASRSISLPVFRHNRSEMRGGVHVDGFLKPVPLLLDASEL